MTYGFNVTIAAETNDGVYQIAPTAAIDATSPDTTSGGVWGAFGWEQNPFWDDSPNNGATAGNTGASMPVQFAPLPSGTAAITYTVDFGDSPTDTPDTAQVTVDSSGPSAMFYHQFPDFGYYIVKTTGSDGSSSTISLYVPPTAAVVNPIADQTVGSIDEGQPVSFSTGVSGLWPAANALAYIDWGDGTGQHPAQLSTNSDGTGTITATLDHNLAPGDYAPTVTLYLPGSAQHDGFGQGSATSSVAVSFSMHVWGASLAINGASATSEAESAGGATPDGVMPVDTSLAPDGTTPEVDLSDPDSSDTAMVPGSINYTAPADSGATWQMSFPSTLRVFTDFNGTLAQIVSGAANAIFGPQGTIPLEFQGCAPGTDQQATVTVTPGSGTDFGGGNPSVGVDVNLDPVQVRVDSNRDGTISFPAGDGTDPDKNTPATPYQFWLNSDPLPNAVGTAEPGYVANSIKNEAELENFTAVEVQVPVGYSPQSNSWELRVSLRGTDSAQGFPQIKLFDVPAPNFLYVTDPTTAASLVGEATVTTGTAHAIGQTPAIVSLRATDLSADGTTLSLIFEGVQGGAGALTFAFYRKAANSAPQLDAQDETYINLVMVNDMYEQVTVGNTPGATPATTATRSGGANFDSGTTPANTDVVVFVHGWRMLPQEKTDYANTAFRRLYWQGFTGRFYAFTWPTKWVSTSRTLGVPVKLLNDPQNFNTSEEIAWESGSALQKFLRSLDTQYGGYQHINIFGHSMGNIVISEALHIEATTTFPQKLVNSYVASEGAIAAEAFDPGQAYAPNVEPLPFNGLEIGVHATNQYANDEYASFMGGAAYFAADNTVTNRMVNFYNPLDYALGPVWREANENISKIDVFKNYRLIKGVWNVWSGSWLNGSYNPVIFVNPAQRYAFFSYMINPPSLALGAAPLVRGPFTMLDAVDLSRLSGISNLPRGANPDLTNFGDDHSGQFDGLNMTKKYYWNAVMKAFGLTPWDPRQTNYTPR